ncbi:MAG TPA: hypothetical protein VGG15_01540 [Terriglobales bacterium]|jgi:hypothetical protein
MRSSRIVAVLALVLMLSSALPAVCLPLASMATPPPVCHQHQGTHNCCRSTPRAPAALPATFHEATLTIVAPAVIQSSLPVTAGEFILVPQVTEFASPPPSILRI